MATKAELSRLWERVESIREELGSLADEIAELYGAEDLPDEEAITGTTGSETPQGLGVKTISGVR